MAKRFRGPTQDDHEEEHSFWTGHLGEKLRALGRSLGAWGFLVLIILLWAADFASCFEPIPSREAAQVVPRPPNLDDSVELELVTRFEAMWGASGHSPADHTVWIVDDSEINAASMGSGRFVLWAGLSRLPGSDIDAVYAHEIAHDQLEHARRGAELRDVTNFIGDLLGTLARDDQTSTVLKKWSGAFVLPSYSRKQEMEADQRAVVLLSASGYANGAVILCRALVHIRRYEGEAGGGLFASHPALSERIGAVKLQMSPSDSVEECR